MNLISIIFICSLPVKKVYAYETMWEDERWCQCTITVVVWDPACQEWQSQTYNGYNLYCVSQPWSMCESASCTAVGGPI